MASETPPLTFLDRIERLIEELRTGGVPISLVEKIDALDAVRSTELDSRDALREALSASLVKSARYLGVFHMVFDMWFPGGGSASAAASYPGEDSLSDQRWQELTVTTLAADDEELTRQVARGGVRRFSGFVPGRAVAGVMYELRTLEKLDVEGAVRRAKAYSTGSVSRLDHWITANEIDDRAELLRRHVRAEIRRLLIKDRGSEAVARTLRPAIPEDLVIANASTTEIELLRRALEPLVHHLARALAVKERRRHQLDVRRTTRRAMATGGVPLDLRYSVKPPPKPDVVMVADVSGSVATFAAFALELIFAVRSSFTKVRSYAFVEGLVEVTEIFATERDPLAAVRAVNRLDGLTWSDGHSDYGRSLVGLAERQGQSISQRSIVIIVGDARTNFRPPEEWALRDIARSAGKVIWLNPDPRELWNTGDSVMGVYGKYCDAVVECRTLRDLAAFVGDLTG